MNTLVKRVFFFLKIGIMIYIKKQFADFRIIGSIKSACSEQGRIAGTISGNKGSVWNEERFI